MFSKSPEVYLSDGGKTKNKKNITKDFTLRYWRSLIQVFLFNILFCFDMSVIFLNWVKYALNQVISGWAFRQAN